MNLAIQTFRRAVGLGICALALLLLLPHASAASFAGGSGTASDPYQITTAAQLNSVRSNLSAHYKLTADITFTEEDFASGGTYYNSGAGWYPIGTASAPFKGTFDGGGHAITGLYQNIVKEVGSSSEEKYVLGGLFGYFGNYSGSISNLSVLDCDIYIENTITSGIAYADAGAVVGHVYGGTIENCHSSGSVIAEADYSRAGGIVGSGSSVIGCSNAAYVSGNYTGGIAGEAYTISQCYNVGLITGGQVGGIVGYGSMVTVKNCYNTGTVTSVSNAGGISGQGGKLTNCYNAGNGCGYAFVGRSENSTVLTNCYYLDCYDSGLYSTTVEDTAVSCSADELTKQDTFEGFDFDTVWTFESGTNYKLPVLRGVTHIEPRNNTTDFAGGNGKPYNPYLISSTAQLDNVRDHQIASYKLTRDITFTAEDFAKDGAFYNDGIGWQPIGTNTAPYIGVFDGNGKTIRGLTITGNASTVYYGLFSHISSSLIHDLHLTDASIDIYLSSQAYVGGIAANADTNAEESRIVNCSFGGSITCDKMKPYNGWLYLGGITGEHGIIRNCRNAAAIRCTLTTPRPYIGGISGYGARITNCVNTGDITFSATSATLYIGGIIGQASTGSVRRCWNSGDITATVTTGTAYSGGILGTTLSYTNGYCYDCYNTGAISGTYAGGIAGGVRGTIGTCYNIGAVSGTNAGGIAGTAHNTTTVTDCYFAADTAASGWGDGTVCGTACTRTAMQSADTFTGFDFNDVWTMDGNEDYLYPELQTVDMVFEKTLLRIELTALPTKTTYFEDEPFDKTGMVVTAYYDDDTSAAVTPEISCDTSTVGTQTVTLTYEEQTLTFEITVQEDPLPGLVAQIVFTYDEETRTATLTNVPEGIRTVLAGYEDSKMVFAELWDTAGTLSCTLPEDISFDILRAFFLTTDWKPIGAPQTYPTAI